MLDLVRQVVLDVSAVDIAQLLIDGQLQELVSHSLIFNVKDLVEDVITEVVLGISPIREGFLIIQGGELILISFSVLCELYDVLPWQFLLVELNMDLWQLPSRV